MKVHRGIGEGRGVQKRGRGEKKNVKESWVGKGVGPIISKGGQFFRVTLGR